MNLPGDDQRPVLDRSQRLDRIMIGGGHTVAFAAALYITLTIFRHLP